jgi:serine protease Do
LFSIEVVPDSREIVMGMGTRELHSRILVVVLFLAAACEMPAQNVMAADDPAPIIKYRDTHPTIDLLDSIRFLSTNKALELEIAIKAAYVKLAPSVVRIYEHNDEGRVGTDGFSGVIIDRNGLILTCSHHHLAPQTAITIELADGRRVPGKTLGRFELNGSKPRHIGNDLGLATITQPNNWPAASVNDAAEPVGGQICLAIGYPGTLRPGQPPLLRAGRIISGAPDWLCFETTTNGVAGDSGGPLFNLQGQILGVLMGYDVNRARYQSTIPLKDARARLEAGEIVSASHLISRALHGHPPQQSVFNPASDLEDRVQQVHKSVIRIMNGPHEVASGLIVDSSGLAITKASLIGSRREWSCRIFYTRDGKMRVKGRVVATSAEHDVALLKLDLHDWFVAPWADERPDVGTFAAPVFGRTAGPLQFAIVGAEARAELAKPNVIPQIPVALMPIMADTSSEPVVNADAWKTAEFDAYRDLFETGDVITHLNGIPTRTRDEFGKVIERLMFAPNQNGDGVDYQTPLPDIFHGDWVSVGIRRKEMTTTVSVPRIHSITVGGLSWHSHPLSLRRESFPTVFAHDFVLRPEQCGGPMVDLAGNVMGLNIARVDETRSLAIPADVLQTIIRDLRQQAENAAKQGT